MYQPYSIHTTCINSQPQSTSIYIKSAQKLNPACQNRFLLAHHYLSFPVWFPIHNTRIYIQRTFRMDMFFFDFK